MSGFRAEQEFLYKPCEQCFLPALSPWSKAWSSSKVSVEAHCGSLLLPSAERNMHLWKRGWGANSSDLYYTFTLGWDKDCSKNAHPFLLPTLGIEMGSYMPEESFCPEDRVWQGEKRSFFSEQLLWWVPRETSICLRWEELSSSNHLFPWLFKTFISSHLISPSLWWMSGRALPPSFVEGELS